MDTIVIKLGGSVLHHLDSSFFTQCAQLKKQGKSIILVHGGGHLVSEWTQKTGKDTAFVNGYRITDETTLTIAEMVLAGTVNKQIVSKLATANLQSIGLSGIDLQLIQAKQRDPQLGYAGEVTSINTTVLHTFLQLEWIPVIASLGVGIDGSHYNINADEIASAIAQAIHATQLILVSDVDGICIGDGSERKLLKQATPQLIEDYIKSEEITGGMIPKARSGIEALHAVDEVWIVNGSNPLDLCSNTVQTFAGTRLIREVSRHVTLS
ncbi:acetylglutamate kinase [Shimazuella kribbensis]|uniref:acetylglutamate kinase n=1 Tax=Shimazuella kribbensis TaxID=139808 RepID=UPI000425BA95|nr:acetylglutamate kinase [Shimazuella kribbensis]